MIHNLINGKPYRLDLALNKKPSPYNYHASLCTVNKLACIYFWH